MQHESFEYIKVSKPLAKWMRKSLKWKVSIVSEHHEHDSDIKASIKNERRKVLIEVKYGKTRKGKDIFHSQFIDALGELIFHMKDTKYYNRYAMAWHIEDKPKLIEKIKQMKSVWRQLGKMNCKYIFFADTNNWKNCKKYAWCDLLKEVNK